MSELQLIGGVKKLNHNNYNSWSTCLKSYLQGQDLWEVVKGNDTQEPARETQDGALRKWMVKAGKALFFLKTTIEDDLLDHIKDASSPKEAWDTLASLLSKKNDAKLQHLENELLSISQKDMTISQYFHKVKSLCREIGDLDPDAKIGDARMKRIIIHGLKAEYHSFVAAVQGWPTQPSIVEFENLLASQESLVKQFSGVQVKSEEAALYVEKSKFKGKMNNSFSRNNSFHRNQYRSKQSDGEKSSRSIDKGDRSGDKPKKYGRRFPYACHNCGRKGHMAKHCRAPVEEGNLATAAETEDGWEVNALMAYVNEDKIIKNESVMGDDFTIHMAHKVDDFIKSKAQSVEIHQANDLKKSIAQSVEGQIQETNVKSQVHVPSTLFDNALVASTGRKINRLDDWIVDSGCSNHMTGDKGRIINPVRYNGSQVVVIADDSRHNIAHVGDVVFPTSSSQKEVTLDNVFHVPGMGKNLFSVPQVTAIGKHVLFGPDSVKVFDEFETASVPVLCGRRCESVYVLSAEAAYIEKTKTSQSVDLWHSRLGHVSYSKLELMMSKQLVAGLPNLPVVKDVVCSGCQFGKAHQQPFHQSSYKSTQPLELVHTDVFGPVRQDSIGGMKYMITFIDDYSRFLWVFFMKEKSEALNKFKLFKVEAETLTGHKVRVLRSDNGGEYRSQEFTDFLNECKIKRQLTCSYTPQQNGVSERKNRHLAEVCGSMMHAKSVPGQYWAEGMQTAAYIINRMPQQKMDYVSPYEKLLKKKPNVSHFKVFGCVCFALVPSSKRHKLEKKSRKCVFVGYDNEKKGWRCFDPDTRTCLVAYNVVFDEASSWWSNESEVSPYITKEKESSESHQVCLPFFGMSDDNDDVVSIGNAEPEQNQVINSSPRSSPWNTGVFTQGSAYLTSPRRSTRVRNPNPKYAHVATVIEEIKEPESFDEAASKQAWRDAMAVEIEALKRNETWELVPKPVEAQPITCKWVYKVKHKTDGSVERCKARLVARGFSQQQGFDYEETFSPVAKLTTVRILLAIAVHNGWPLYQMDVDNAFLYGTLDHVLYMTQPKGFESKSHPNYVCRLKKALYGLKQSPRSWFGKMGEFLTHNGFVSSNSDASLFVKSCGSQVAVVLVYVDDLIITGNCEVEINQFKVNLCTRFHMKDLGKLQRFLGLELAYEKDGALLHQTKYTTDVLYRFGMLDSKPTYTPVDPNTRLHKDEGIKLDDATMYRKMVGSLIYLTLTRPDLAYSVGVLSRFMQQPRRPHLHALRRVLHYVKATIGMGISFKRETNFKLSGFCDADYGGDPSTRRSTTGYVFLLGGGAVSWCSKLQPTVSLSTTEAEYRAASMAAQECIWLKQVLTDLKQTFEDPIVLRCDNKSTIQLASNPTIHGRSKHIEVDCHYVREKVLQGKISLVYVNTDEQSADMFTKGLSKPKMEKFMSKLNMKKVGVEREFVENTTPKPRHESTH